MQRILLDDLPAPVSHYCHAGRANDRVWISVMVGMRNDGSVPEDVEEQFQIAIDCLDSALRAAGGRPEHIVKVQVFLTDASDRAKINPIRENYFGTHRPASTLIEVSGLISPELKVEIEAEAVVG